MCDERCRAVEFKAVLQHLCDGHDGEIRVAGQVVVQHVLHVIYAVTADAGDLGNGHAKGCEIAHAGAAKVAKAAGYRLSALVQRFHIKGAYEFQAYLVIDCPDY